MKMYMFFRIYESNRKKKKDKNDNPTSDDYKFEKVRYI